MEITREQYERSYELGREKLNDPRLGIAQARHRAAATGIKVTSAADLIYFVGHLVRGELYTRGASATITDDYLTWIYRDFGGAGLKNGLEALRKHITYREHARPAKFHSLRRVLAKHQQILQQPTTGEPVVHLHWADAATKDYVDILPLRFFVKEGTTRGVTHVTRHREGKEYLAKCDVAVNANSAEFDYEPYAAFNRQQGMDLGVARLQFADSDRTAIASIEWRPATGRGFVPGEISSTTYEAPPAPPYNPPEQPKKKRLQLVTERPGQASFRRSLKSAYGQCCCFTRCAVPEALEGAHIDPYVSQASDNIRNGLLLRRDVHALFDKHLIAVEPTTHVIHVAKSVLALVGYHDLQGQAIRPPKDATHTPDDGALKRRWEHFKRRDI